MFVNINDKGQRKMSENDGTYKALLLSYNKLKEENELLKAKAELMQSAKRTEELYLKALDAMRSYRGDNNVPEEEL
mgnify:CR=1 FL=1